MSCGLIGAHQPTHYSSNARSSWSGETDDEQAYTQYIAHWHDELAAAPELVGQLPA